MKATILGTDHLTQWQDFEGRLQPIVRDICLKGNLDLIAEEWSTKRYRDAETVGKKVAASLSIAWDNVEMSDERMAELGILECVRRRRPELDDIAGVLVQEIPDTVYMPNADRLREEHWIQQIQIKKPSRGVLMICGLIHVAPLAVRMTASGFTVGTNSLCEHAWYRSKYGKKCDDVELNLKEDSC